MSRTLKHPRPPRPEYHANYYEANKEYFKNYYETRTRTCQLKKLYNITLEEYNKMFDSQKGCCDICGKHRNMFKRHLAVDHNHITGKNRGLLCLQCNTSLESYEINKDSFEIYLNKHKERLPLVHCHL